MSQLVHQGFSCTLICALVALGACQPANQTNSKETSAAAAATDLPSALPAVPDSNVIIISFDALRADGLGTYGYARGTSPNIDRFAQQAVVFDQAYSAAPVTPTSFAAAFTSQLPFRVFRQWNLVTDSTLAGAFSAAGYTTTAMLNNSQVTDERNFNLGFEQYQYFEAISDDEVLERGIRWLFKNKDTKFFFWIHFLSPHSPYDYRAPSSQFYDEGYDGEYKITTTSRFESERPEDAQRIRDLYDGEIFYADDLFGQLFDFLEQQGLLDTTLVVLTADHGEEFKERGSYQHRYLFEETVRIPLIVRHPTGQSLRSDTLYSNVDLWPTLAGLTGIEPPQQGDGWNLLASPKEEEETERAVASIAMTDQHYRGLNLRRGDAKLILTCIPELKAELYDLAADPKESTDLATTDNARVRDLLQMARLITGTEDPCRAIEDALAGVDASEGLSPETIESLRALGYIQ